MRPSWDDYFLGIATAVATRADCSRRKVGAVLVDQQHRILATGYNGAPPGRTGCLEGACPRGTKTKEQLPGYMFGNNDFSDCISVHAEANTLLYADGWQSRGATLYSTDMPCLSCQKLIEGAGIARVVWPSGLWVAPNNAVG